MACVPDRLCAPHAVHVECGSHAAAVLLARAMLGPRKWPTLPPSMARRGRDGASTACALHNARAGWEPFRRVRQRCLPVARRLGLTRLAQVGRSRISRPTVARSQLSGTILCDRIQVAQWLLEPCRQKVTYVDIAGRSVSATAAELCVFSDGCYEVQRPDGNMWTHQEFEAILIRTRADGVFDLDVLYSHVRKIGGGEVLEDDSSIPQGILSVGWRVPVVPAAGAGVMAPGASLALLPGRGGADAPLNPAWAALCDVGAGGFTCRVESPNRLVLIFVNTDAGCSQ